MLPFLKRSKILHSYRSSQIRPLHSLPRKIPTYLKRWDPILHRSHKPDLEIEDASWLVASNEQDAAELRMSIRKVNLLLRYASKDVDADAEIKEPMLKAYTRAVELDPFLSDRVSDAASSILARIRNVEPPSIIDVHKHYRSEKEWFEYLESLTLQGSELKAAIIWDADHFRLREHQQNADVREYHARFLEAGVKLQAYAGNLLQARRLMNQLYNIHPHWDTSAMMIVFRAHTSTDNPKNHEYARTIRSKMKILKAGNLRLEDFDGWLVGFLEARQLKYAQKVFREMIREGYLTTINTAEDSVEVLKRLNMLYRLASDPDSMSRLARDALSILPAPYHAYIYGDWLKSTVVQRAPQASVDIFASMMQQGYRPGTFHSNMLLQAMMRTKESQYVLKAENIGWNMVEAMRRSISKDYVPDPIPEQIHKRITDKDFVRKLLNDHGRSTVANTATFAILMQHHARKLQWDYVEYLFRQLQDAKMQPNTAILNVLIDSECRKGKFARAWTIYQELTLPSSDGKSEGIFPDGATIRHLWKNLRLALADTANRTDVGLPEPRQLLKETVDWWLRCRSRYDADRFKQGIAAADGGAITALILHCFSYKQDLVGALVALHVLREQFDIFPDHKAANIIQRQMAWVDMAGESPDVRQQYFKSQAHKGRGRHVAELFARAAHSRMEWHRSDGVEVEELASDEARELNLNMLSEVMRSFMVLQHAPGAVEEQVEAAKRSVGLPRLETGDVTAWDVAPEEEEGGENGNEKR